MEIFNNLVIKNEILKGIEKKGFLEMTEVQEKVIPIAIDNKDLIIQSPTGTGKTCAFAIPILQKIDYENSDIQSIVLVPTRELAVQVANEINEIAFFFKSYSALAIYGGEFIDIQIRNLRKRPKIVVATPGRLLDHLRRKTIKLGEVKILVLDEADEMLNMGFKEDLELIFDEMQNVEQKMLFSATISREIENIAKKLLKDSVLVRISKSDLTVSTISQKYIEVSEKEKVEVMSRIIDINGYKLVMVFCNTKRDVDEVTSKLQFRGYMVDSLHGDMKQMQRDRVMHRFRKGLVNILVASDVAARGLDIDDVDVVFNYDVPTDPEYYVHRIGRTGRAKKSGLAIMLVKREEKYSMKNILAFSKTEISRMEVPGIESVIDVRVNKVIKEALEKNVFNKNSIYVEKIISKIEPENIMDLLKGLILMQLTDVEEEVQKTSRPSKSTRFFLGLGKKDRFNKMSLIDHISKVTSLPKNEINDVSVQDNFSFFDTPTVNADKVLYGFATNPYKGRLVTIEEAKSKKRR
ncbi:MAG: DEAD/DEAH box helicase [Bacilli bacterium]|nr:DEAD/DEAH box helicase [Bacilli bacterium]